METINRKVSEQGTKKGSGGSLAETERYKDLGEYYIGRMQEAMEEWFSKPREGYHVSDICLCPRQKVFREIDRVPLTQRQLVSTQQEKQFMRQYNCCS